MTKPKLGVASDGRPMHYSVGALIRKGESFLLFNRVRPPYGYAGPAGHLDENEEDPAKAVIREVQEETGLVVTKTRLLFQEELPWDTCRHGVPVHYWYLFECEVSGDMRPDQAEALDVGWFTPKKSWPTKLEPCWEHWFKKLNIIV